MITPNPQLAHLLLHCFMKQILNIVNRIREKKEDEKWLKKKSGKII